MMAAMTPSEQVHDEAIRALELAPVRWPDYVDNGKPAELHDIANQLDAIAERAARLSAYINSRTLDNAADKDHGHAKAVKHQNRVAAKVRKALGFTYPEQNMSF